MLQPRKNVRTHMFISDSQTSSNHTYLYIQPDDVLKLLICYFQHVIKSQKDMTRRVTRLQWEYVRQWGNTLVIEMISHLKQLEALQQNIKYIYLQGVQEKLFFFQEFSIIIKNHNFSWTHCMLTNKPLEPILTNRLTYQYKNLSVHMVVLYENYTYKKV